MKDFFDLIALTVNFFGLMLMAFGTWKVFLSTEVSQVFSLVQKKTISSIEAIYGILSKKSNIVNHPMNKSPIMLDVETFNKAVFLIVWGFALQFFSIVISFVNLSFHMFYKGAG
jgi:hypothetical protein